jgi:hypothetical protein
MQIYLNNFSLQAALGQYFAIFKRVTTAVQSRLVCPSCPVSLVLSQLPYPECPATVVPSLFPCPTCPVLSDLSRLSCPPILFTYHVPLVLSQLSCSIALVHSSLVPSVRSLLSYPGVPSLCPFLPDLSRLTCQANLSRLTCLGYPAS